MTVDNLLTIDPMIGIEQADIEEFLTLSNKNVSFVTNILQTLQFRVDRLVFICYTLFINGIYKWRSFK